MERPLFTVSSITRAMQARDLLRRHGIQATVERVPHTPMGCGYGVYAPGRAQEALPILIRAGYLAGGQGGGPR